ncbi:MAG: lytic murein transglycosylase [Thiolinea sp.]
MARIIQLGLLFAAMLFGYSAIADDEFELWKQAFRQTAEQSGIRPDILDIAFTGLQPHRKVLRLDAHQPEFTRPIWEYLENAASPERLDLGQLRLQEHGPLLERIAAHYGVDAHYLVAIWGMESSYGRDTGNYSVIRSLATLAYAGREERRAFWREQLLAALRILQRGDMSMVELRGSWAGAIGHTQFIPTTFEAYAVDFDGDGHRNLKDSMADALASTANYLAKSGWQSGLKWGEEVRLPDDFDWNLADPAIWKAAERWTLENRILQYDGDLLSGGAAEGFVLLPAGYRGPAFMAYQNYTVILKYNNAVSYAMAVGYLAERLRGGPAIAAAWPREDMRLSHEQKSELQELLSAVGYSTEGIDGKIGPNTRSALRSWQADVGFPPDGYVTLEHLQRLRKQSAVRRGSLQ